MATPVYFADMNNMSLKAQYDHVFSKAKWTHLSGGPQISLRKAAIIISAVRYLEKMAYHPDAFDTENIRPDMALLCLRDMHAQITGAEFEAIDLSILWEVNSALPQMMSMAMGLLNGETCKILEQILIKEEADCGLTKYVVHADEYDALFKERTELVESELVVDSVTGVYVLEPY